MKHMTEDTLAELKSREMQIKREIHARTTRNVFGHKGVNSYGINAEGFTIGLGYDSDEIRAALPQEIEGYPVTVRYNGEVRAC
jgi:hypothetical protein